jgi:response regulator RpfG family c-di-GMP phosphodiesterase
MFYKKDKLPDVILLDIKTLIMHGWQFLNKYIILKSKIKKRVLVYVVTSSNNPEDFIQTKSIHEVIDYLVKPINSKQ